MKHQPPSGRGGIDILGQRPEALRLAAEVGRRWPDFMWGHSMAAGLHASGGDWKSTAQSARKALALDPLALTGDTSALVAQVMAWAQPLLPQGPVLVYSTAEPEAVKAIQARLGVAEAGTLVEHALAAVARALAQAGVQQLVVAGGETSGACVQALGISQLQIGPQIDPGVPWCYAHSPLVDEALHLTLKSGNFGTVDFFTKAFEQLR